MGLEDLKINTFSGINASPVPPTPSSPGNASHLISSFNALIDQIIEEMSSKLGSDQASSFYQIGDQRALGAGFFSETASLSTLEASDGVLLLDISTSNSFRVRIEDFCQLSASINPLRRGQVIDIIFLFVEGQITLGSAFVGNAPDVSLAGDIQIISYKLASTFSGTTKLFEMSRSEVYPASAGAY